MKITCYECEYWEQNESTPEFGQCRRKAPNPIRSESEGFIGAYNHRAIWLYVRINDYCGEAVLKKDKRERIPDEIKRQEVKFDTLPEISEFAASVEKAKKELAKKR